MRKHVQRRHDAHLRAHSVCTEHSALLDAAAGGQKTLEAARDAQGRSASKQALGRTCWHGSTRGETVSGEERAQRGRRVGELWAVAGSAAGIQVTVAGVMGCDPDDKNIRSGEGERV
jgi:hypothetical protein